MKKSIFFFAALLLAACTAFISCNNEILQPDDNSAVGNNTFIFSIAATKGDAATKALELNGNTLNAIWDGSERVYVFKNDQQIGILTPDDNTIYPDKNSCTLKGPFTTAPANGDVLTLYLNSNNYLGQDGTLDFIADYCDYAVATLTVTGVNNGQIESAEGKANFVSKQAIVKFSLTDGNNSAIRPTDVSINYGSGIVVLTEIPTATYTTNGGDFLYIAVPGFSNKTITIHAFVGDDVYTYTASSKSLTNGHFYAGTVKMTKLPEGALPGQFSVSDAKKIRFAKGNLKYSNGIWSFHEKQYDRCFNTEQAVVTSAYVQTGTFDLFPWATSGWSGSGVEYYQPWMYGSETYKEYTQYIIDHDTQNDMTGAYAQADWGVYNRISNGGNTEGIWRTPTQNELDYMIRAHVNRGDGGRMVNYPQSTGTWLSSIAVSSSNIVNGIFILPDNWIWPDGYPQLDGKGFSDNRYTLQQWRVMEVAGAVFLPATGNRSGGDKDNYGNLNDLCVYGVNGHGYYWTSTLVDVNEAHSREGDGAILEFYEGAQSYGNTVAVFNSGYPNTFWRRDGCSVRLIKD